MKAALGLRVHSGWAAAVVVGGTLESPTILGRRRLIFADEEKLPGAKQPYHAAEDHALEDATRMMARYVADADRRALNDLRETRDAAAVAGHRVGGCGLLLASGRPLPGLAQTLASHALIHTADGEHFRDALRSAASGLSLKVTEVRERDVEALVAERAGVSVDELKSRIAGLGKALGPPWTQDQKLAALAGLLALYAR